MPDEKAKVPGFGTIILERMGQPPALPQQQPPEVAEPAWPPEPPGCLPALRRRQQLALTALAAGLGTSGAAKVAEVSRQTVYNWMRDEVFASALADWRARATKTVHDRLLAVADQAAQCVVHSIKKNNPKTALALLKGMGLMKREPEE